MRYRRRLPARWAPSAVERRRPGRTGRAGRRDGAPGRMDVGSLRDRAGDVLAVDRAGPAERRGGVMSSRDDQPDAGGAGPESWDTKTVVSVLGTFLIPQNHSADIAWRRGGLYQTNSRRKVARTACRPGDRADASSTTRRALPLNIRACAGSRIRSRRGAPPDDRYAGLPCAATPVARPR